MTHPSQLTLPRGPTHRVASRTDASSQVAQKWDLGIALLAGVLLLTIFEGAARKWLFAGNPYLRYAAYFSKDFIFLWAAYLGARRGKQFHLSWFVLCTGLILLPSIVSTMANSNAVGMALSFRAYVAVPLCAFLAAPLVRSFRDVERCAVLVALATVAVGALGALQYRLPQGHILNRYDSGTEASRSEMSGGHVRATGTFAYIAGMTVMAGLGAWAGMILVLKIPGRTKRIRQIGMAALAASLVCALVSMSRSALLVWGITTAGGWLLYARANQALAAVLGVLVLVASFGLANPAEQLEAKAGGNSLAAGMLNRIRSSDTFADRLDGVLNEIVIGVTAYPMGEGLGLGQPGGMYASYNIRASGGTEFEWGRIAFEVGIAGLIGALLIRFVAGLMCWNALRATSDPVRRLVLATVLPFFGIMALGLMAFNHTGNSAAWAVMTFALSVLPHQRHATIASRGGGQL